MSWNYRIIRYADPDAGFGLHEVYYGCDGKPETMTVEPITFTASAEEGAVGIVASLRQAVADAERLPVLDEKLITDAASLEKRRQP
jgi:hypothetical protein